MSHLPQPAQAITMVPSTTPGGENSQRNKYKSTLKNLGVAEIVLGSISVFLCMISLIYVQTLPYYYRYGLTNVSAGIWCGIFPIISGSFGVCAKKNPSVCIYNTNMVMCIVSACMLFTLLIISCIAAADTSTGLVVIHSLIALVSFAAMVINIVHSAYCCAGVCCGHKKPAAFVVYNAPQPVANSQYVQLANGQYMMVQNPTIVGQPYPAVPVIQATPQPVMYSQAASSSYVYPQTQMPPQPHINPTKEQEAATMAPVNPQGATSIPPAYDAHSFGDHSQI